MDLALHHGQVITPWGRLELSVYIQGAYIRDLAPPGAYPARHELDCRHLLVMPGVIDSQVHFREPGFPHKETLATGTRAALKGGVTTIFDMPNTKPPTLDEAALDEKKARAARTAACHYAFFVGASHENASRLATLERYPGVCGVKLFMGSSTGDLLVHESPHLERVVQSGTRRMAIHAELESRLRARRDKARRNDVASHTDCRDVKTAFLATQHIIQLAERYQRPIHILHVSTAEELELIVRHKSLVSMEVTPQHLTLASPMCYRDLGTLAQMNPPIRDERHRAALWRAVQSGLVDVVGSDHAPHSLEEKQQIYPDTPSGMPGVQTLLPLLLHHAAAGHLSYERIADLTAHGPQRLYQIRERGRILPGWRADLVLVDSQRSWTVEKPWLASQCGWSPFEGMRLTGFPTATILDGVLACQEGEILQNPRGSLVQFLHAN